MEDIPVPSAHKGPSRVVTDQGRRVAFWFFVVAQCLIYVLLLWNFRHRWFSFDEWDYLAGRTAGSLDSLFRPHNEHWSTLPILYYRLLWTLNGIRSYMPFQASVLALHLAIGCLLRVVMIRAKASPWVATVAALVFSLFGAGSFNIADAFQIGFDGSIFFGLVYLLLADHAGRWDRKDWLGLLAGLAALMCSGVGVTMVIIVAIGVALRHGVRRAAIGAVVLGTAYGVWFAAFGHAAYSRHGTIPQIVKFGVFGLGASFSAIGHSPIVGALLAVLVVGGFVASVHARGIASLRTIYAAPASLMVGALIFLLITGIGRATGTQPGVDTYGASRYLYVVAALMLPALAVAASFTIQRWPVATPAVLVLLVIGVPGNVMLLHDQRYQVPDQYRQLLLSTPRLPVAKRLPRSVLTDPYFDPIMTLGWLRDGVKQGRVPPPRPAPSARQAASWTLGLSWQKASPASVGECRTVTLPVTTFVDGGSSLLIQSPVEVTYLDRPGSEVGPLSLSPSASVPVTAYRTYSPMTVSITARAMGHPVELCDVKSTRGPSGP